jgi:hypothetical protein
LCVCFFFFKEWMVHSCSDKGEEELEELPWHSITIM